MTTGKISNTFIDSSQKCSSQRNCSNAMFFIASAAGIEDRNTNKLKTAIKSYLKKEGISTIRTDGYISRNNWCLTLD